METRHATKRQQKAKKKKRAKRRERRHENAMEQQGEDRSEAQLRLNEQKARWRQVKAQVAAVVNDNLRQAQVNARWNANKLSRLCHEQEKQRAQEVAFETALAKPQASAAAPAQELQCAAANAQDQTSIVQPLEHCVELLVSGSSRQAQGQCHVVYVQTDPDWQSMYDRLEVREQEARTRLYELHCFQYYELWCQRPTLSAHDRRQVRGVKAGRQNRRGHFAIG